METDAASIERLGSDQLWTAAKSGGGKERPAAAQQLGEFGERLTQGSPNAEAMGWQMLALWQGTIIWWGFTRDKDPEEAIKTALVDWWQSVSKSGRPTAS